MNIELEEQKIIRQSYKLLLLICSVAIFLVGNGQIIGALGFLIYYLLIEFFFEFFKKRNKTRIKALIILIFSFPPLAFIVFGIIFLFFLVIYGIIYQYFILEHPIEQIIEKIFGLFFNKYGLFRIFTANNQSQQISLDMGNFFFPAFFSVWFFYYSYYELNENKFIGAIFKFLTLLLLLLLFSVIWYILIMLNVINAFVSIQLFKTDLFELFNLKLLKFK